MVNKFQTAGLIFIIGSAWLGLLQFISYYFNLDEKGQDFLHLINGYVGIGFLTLMMTF